MHIQWVAKDWHIFKNFNFESVGFNLVKYKNFDHLVHAINNGKYPVVTVLKERYSSENDGSHVMVATGIKHKDGVECIQLKKLICWQPKWARNSSIHEIHYLTVGFQPKTWQWLWTFHRCSLLAIEQKHDGYVLHSISSMRLIFETKYDDFIQYTFDSFPLDFYYFDTSLNKA